jgi:hypothetical protein
MTRTHRRISHTLSNVASVLLACFVLFTNASALGVTFSEDTYIGPGDATYDNEDIVVDGCTLTVDGTHPFNSLLVINNGVVTHSPNGATQEFWMDLTIAAHVTVEAGSRIDVDGMGYPAETGPGAGGEDYGYGSGAGYGGNGGINHRSTPGGLAYGSIVEPTDLGSGGGHSSNGGSGGGAIRLSVNGTLTVDGNVTADGNDAATHGGGGSGGSVYLTVGTLVGAGTISADGGQSGHVQYAGSGAGGRIAIEYTTNGFAGNISAYSGTNAFQVGGAGTIYTVASGRGAADLLVDNGGSSGAWTPIESPTAFGVTIRNGAIVYPTAAMTVADLDVEAAGVLTHVAGGQGIDITVQGDATIDTDAAISVDGGGYPAETGPGAGGEDYGYGSGAGYGGNGGINHRSTPGGPAYGSIVQPTELGSGGGHFSNGGSGGGAIRLSVNGTLTVDGNLTADGNDAATYGGGGSGGSVYLTVGTLVGGGTISANGGQSGHGQYAGSGAGGRIAIEYTTNSFTGNISAYGGTNAFQVGGAGTIYTVASGKGLGDLLVDNGGSSGAWTPLTSPVAFDLTIGSGAIAYPTAAMAIGNLAVAAGGLFTHVAEDTNFDITVQGDATIEADAAVSADGMGYPAEIGPGAGGEDYGYGSGAGYGGNGGINHRSTPGGLAYGSIVQPTELGSGGGHFSNGGSGGGAIRLSVNGTLTVDGNLTADGNNASTNGGGGSGGSVYLTVGTLVGGGAISADGGQSGHGQYAGGGAGGRIAIECTTNSFAGNISAYGGTNAFQVGGAGTIYTVVSGKGAGDLLVDNGAYSGAWTPLTSPMAFDLTIGSGAIAYPTAAMTIGDLNVATGGVFTHPAEDTNFVITVQGDATIDIDGAISVDGMGYPAETGPGAGDESYGCGAGAGYGGNGGNNYAAAPGGLAYGSIVQPTDLGSGGGHPDGGSGGGTIRLYVNGTLTVDGNLTADGNHADTNGGGGSGGSVYLTVGTLVGGGTISADGGQSGHGQYAGGGAGGRIAIEYTTNSFAGNISAYGGINAFQVGGAGTIYTVASGRGAGDLLLDNGGSSGAWTPLTSPVAFDLTIGSGAIAYPTAALTIGDLNVATGGVFTHPAEDTNFEITVQGDATIEAGAAISADGMGYPAETGPGAGDESYGYGAGAGYGGEGGQNYHGAPGGVAYGAAEKPVCLGSGGGHWSNGGRGGGLIHLVVDGTLNVGGQLSANGNNAGSTGGGGSGGSVFLHVGTLDGAGFISAGGGNSGHMQAGGGAGGRIAIYSCSVLMPLEQIIAPGGAGWENGEDGTIFFGSGTVEILVHPMDQRAYEDEPVTFTVVATGDGELSYQWRKNGLDLVDDDRISGATTDTLTIDPVVLADVGDYDVIVTDDCGPFPSDAALLIVPPDLNGDGCVGHSDLGILLSDWNCTDGDCVGDCDGDGDTDHSDLGVLLAHWGQGCP